MRRHTQTNALQSMTLSFKDWGFKLALAFLLLFSAMLLTLNYSKHPLLIQMRTGLSEGFAPVVSFVSQPREAISHMGEQWQQWQQMSAINKQLSADNAELKRWRLAAIQLQEENANLRQLLHLPSRTAPHYVTARVQHSSIGPYGKTTVIKAGTAQRVTEDMVVTNAEGLVGRLAEVGKNQSRILRLTDINSRIGVLIGGHKTRAVATGDGDNLLQLRYITKDAPVKVGDAVQSSGDSGLLPANLPVAIVTEVNGNQVLAKPVVDWSKLTYVTLLSLEKEM